MNMAYSAESRPCLTQCQYLSLPPFDLKVPHARHGVCDKLECMGSILCVKQLACDLIRIVVCCDIHELAPLKEQRGDLRQPLYTHREKRKQLWHLSPCGHPPMNSQGPSSPFRKIPRGPVRSSFFRVLETKQVLYVASIALWEASYLSQ